MTLNKTEKEVQNYIKGRNKSFKHAFEGLFYAIRTQKNVMIHAIITVLVISVSFIFKLSQMEWIAVLVAIALVWIAELINTALETIVDFICPEIHPLAKKAKDLSAAFVLIAAILAFCIGCIIFIPKLLSFIR